MRTRLAMNQFTTPKQSFGEDVQLYANLGITDIGVMRTKIEEYGIEQGRKLLQATGMHVSSLCIAGFFTSQDSLERQRRIEDSLRAIDLASQIAAATLIIIAGPVDAQSPQAAIDSFQESLAYIIPVAQDAHVKLGVEPLHPMFAAEASALCSLHDALTVIAPFPEETVGVVIDTYHLWWQSQLLSAIRQAGKRIYGVHLSDWSMSTSSFCDREIPGRGIIQWREIIRAIEETGYKGMYEFEILSESLWTLPPHILLQECFLSYDKYIDPYLQNTV